MKQTFLLANNFCNSSDMCHERQMLLYILGMGCAKKHSLCKETSFGCSEHPKELWKGFVWWSNHHFLTLFFKTEALSHIIWQKSTCQIIFYFKIICFYLRICSGFQTVVIKKKKNLHITDEISKKYCDKCFEKKQPFSYLFPLITQEKGDIPEDNIPEIDAKECMILQGTDMPVKPMSTR